MTPYRIFAGVTAGLSAVILLLTQLVGGPNESTVPELEPLPAPSVLTPSSVPSRPPQPTPTDGQPAVVGTVVYEHDFSSPTGGLLGGASSDTGTNQFGTRFASYTGQGTLLIRAESELADYVGGASTEGLVVGGRELIDLADVSIEADVTPVDLGVGANWGLACRRNRDLGRFYFAYIGDAGGHAGASIIRQDGPGVGWTEIATTNTLPDGETIGEGQTNRLRLDCLGSRITLYVDGREVVEGTDASLSTGGAALFVNPLGGPAEAEFDHLVISEA